MALPAIAKHIRGLTPGEFDAFVAALGPEEACALLDSWELWKLPHQATPEGEWRRWLCQWGRGSGKTYTGARITNEIARDRKLVRTGEIVIVGRTYSQAQRDLVEGSSGILATAPRDFVPRWYPGKGDGGLLIWPNKVRGYVLSGDKSSSVLGCNAAWVWADEVAAWPDPETSWWEHIEPACRIGFARLLITTTPKPTDFLRKLIKLSDTVVTRASMYDNPLLAEVSRRAFERVYKGTRRGREQLDGELLDDLNGSLWRGEFLRREGLPVLERVVVAVDPAVTSNDESDETGIVVCGLGSDGRGYVLEDCSGKHSAHEWPAIVVSLFRKWSADRVIAEVNNGGDLVESVIRAVDPNVSYRAVRASRGKVVRAEPVAALYEQGKVTHVGIHATLEAQMESWVPGARKSPDRVDALVYGLTSLLLPSEEVGRSGPIDAYL